MSIEIIQTETKMQKKRAKIFSKSEIGKILSNNPMWVNEVPTKNVAE